MNDNAFGSGGGGISLGFGANTNLPGPALLSSTSQENNARVSAPHQLPISQGPPKPNYSAFSTYGGSQSTSQTGTPAPSLFQQQQQLASRQTPQPASDPFAALASPIRQSTPQQAPATTSASMFDFANPKPAPAPASSNDDDEWAFSSALPENNGLPTSNEIIVTDSTLRVVMHASRLSSTDSVIEMTVKFSNKQALQVTELTFQVAVTKGFQLQLKPQTGRSLQPFQNDGIQQSIRLSGVERGQAAVRIRWKISYRLGAELKNENGEISGLGIE